MVASVRTSPGGNALMLRLGCRSQTATGVQTHEEVVEAMYRFAAVPGLWLVPDVQWVHRPSGTDAYADALVLALRV